MSTPVRARRLAALAVSLSVLASARAQNDDCAGAIAVPIGTTVNLSNAGATLSQGIPGGCGSIGADVWFRHTATCTGTLTATTCGVTNFDTVVQVLGGTCGTLVDLGCNDDQCGVQSLVTAPVTSGTTYFIRVGGYNGATGTFSLTVGCAPAGNPDDNCTGATALSLGTNGPFSNSGYNSSPPAWPCAPGSNDRWFSFAANFTGPHTIQTCSPSLTMDTVLEVFSGTCTSLTSLACNDDSCSLGSSVQVNLAAGTTYYVRVGGYSGSQGTFDVLVSLGNGTGSIRLATASGCGTGTLTFSGMPSLGSSFTATFGGVTGAPFLGIGFRNPAQLFCGCSFGTDWSSAIFGTTLNVTVPSNPSYINVRFFLQGADLGATGGCGFIPYTLTDSYEITIG